MSTTLDAAMKEKILKSVMFHLATYSVFDELRLLDLRDKPQYLMTQKDIEYLQIHQAYLDYMPRHDIFSELGTASDSYSSFGNVYLKVPLRPYLFGVDSISFEKTKEKVKETRIRTVPKKVLFFTKNVEEKYEVEVEKDKYRAVITPEMIDLCHEITETLKKIGYLEAKAQFNIVSMTSYGRSVDECVSWADIQEKRTKSNLLLADYYFSNALEPLGGEMYLVREDGLAAYDTHGIGFVTLEFQATIGDQRWDICKNFADARKIACKYYEEHYGEIDCFK